MARGKHEIKKEKPDGIKKLFDSGKKIITVWLIFWSTIWVSLSYLLAFLNRKEIAESLSENVVAIVIGSFVTYATASVLEHISESKRGNINSVPCTEQKSELDESTTSI